MNIFLILSMTNLDEFSSPSLDVDDILIGFRILIIAAPTFKIIWAQTVSCMSNWGKERWESKEGRQATMLCEDDEYNCENHHENKHRVRTRYYIRITLEWEQPEHVG